MTMKKIMPLGSILCLMAGAAVVGLAANQDEPTRRNERRGKQVAFADGEKDPAPPPAAPPGPRPDDQRKVIRGVVQSFRKNPEGEVDGIVFEDKQELHFPPDVGERVAKIAAVKDEIEVNVVTPPARRDSQGPNRAPRPRIESIKNLKSGETATFAPRQPGGNGPPIPPGGESRPPRNDQGPPAREARTPSESAPSSDPAKSRGNLPQLVVTSPAFEAGGSIPVEFTGDGDGVSPPIEWSGAPAGTKTFAINVWHVPGPGGMKSYWVVYNIPANVHKLAKNDGSTGTVGTNDKNRREYDPMKSKGPGVKKYHLTVYALSTELELSPDTATRANLLTAIKDVTLAEGTLDWQYDRSGANGAGAKPEGRAPKEDRPAGPPPSR